MPHHLPRNRATILPTCCDNSWFWQHHFHLQFWKLSWSDTSTLCITVVQDWLFRTGCSGQAADYSVDHQQHIAWTDLLGVVAENLCVGSIECFQDSAWKLHYPRICLVHLLTAWLLLPASYGWRINPVECMMSESMMREQIQQCCATFLWRLVRKWKIPWNYSSSSPQYPLPWTGRKEVWSVYK